MNSRSVDFPIDVCKKSPSIPNSGKVLSGFRAKILPRSSRIRILLSIFISFNSLSVKVSLPVSNSSRKEHRISLISVTTRYMAKGKIYVTHSQYRSYIEILLLPVLTVSHPISVCKASSSALCSYDLPMNPRVSSVGESIGHVGFEGSPVSGQDTTGADRIRWEASSTSACSTVAESLIRTTF